MDVSAVPERAKAALTHKLGPLPVWGWGALGIGALVLVRVLGARRGASGSAGATVGPLPPNALGAGGGGGGDGSVPNPSPSAPSTTSPNPLFPFRSHPLIRVPAPSTPTDSTPPSAPATPATPSAGGTNLLGQLFGSVPPPPGTVIVNDQSAGSDLGTFVQGVIGMPNIPSSAIFPGSSIPGFVGPAGGIPVSGPWDPSSGISKAVWDANRIDPLGGVGPNARVTWDSATRTWVTWVPPGQA